MGMINKNILLILAFLFISATLFSLSVDGIDLSGSFIWVRNEIYDATPEDKGTDTLISGFGVGFPMTIIKNWTLWPGITLYMENYDYLENRGLSMPIDVASAEHLKTLCIFLDIPVGYRFDFQDFSIGIQGGPAFFLRFPMWGPGSDSRKDMAKSFYKGGRFIYFSVDFWGSMKLMDRLTVYIREQTFFPLFNIWVRDDIPFFEGFSINASIGLIIYFNKTPKQESLP